MLASTKTNARFYFNVTFSSAYITEQAKSLLDKRQKPIKLAGSSEAGWDVVQGYESQDIASDYEEC